MSITKCSPSRQTALLGEQVEYTVAQSDEAAEPRIDVGIDGIRVVIPEGSAADPRELLAENAAWVLNKRDKFERYRDTVPDREFVEGALFPYLGDDRELVIEPRQQSVVTADAIYLRQSAVSQSSVKTALRNFYQRNARDEFQNRLQTYSDRMDVTYDSLQVRNQRTKWGSCSSNGTISLNWRLLMAPEEIVDYVIIHELAHLEIPDHSEAFWALVAEYDPAYQAHADWLEENSSQLVFSEEDL